MAAPRPTSSRRRQRPDGTCTGFSRRSRTRTSTPIRAVESGRSGGRLGTRSTRSGPTPGRPRGGRSAGSGSTILTCRRASAMPWGSHCRTRRPPSRRARSTTSGRAWTRSSTWPANDWQASLTIGWATAPAGPALPCQSRSRSPRTVERRRPSSASPMPTTRRASFERRAPRRARRSPMHGALPKPDPYPPIEPYETGKLDVGDGQSIYWEVSGNPAGKAAIALHGGPGSGSSPGRRRWFDPTRYRLVQLDQRGCGRSTPHAGDLSTDLATNTTHHLIADIERLREHLGIERWLVWGASWGVTLALAYAERHPQRVSEMVLLSITNTRRADVHWLAHETGRYFPEEWARFQAGVPEAERDGDLVAAYDRLLNAHPDRAVRLQAARDWVAWEDAILSLEGGLRRAEPALG